MTIDIIAMIKCARCDREQEVAIREDVNQDSYSFQTTNILSDANKQGRYQWERLDENGRSVFDQRFGACRILCAGCADDYKKFVREQKERNNDFFKSS
ncbi:MAG: hypothetical protein FWE94_07525 [Coriobacteriia bacterium]|nr:hypothetical protein [Coriobacteriia bacterium]